MRILRLFVTGILASSGLFLQGQPSTETRQPEVVTLEAYTVVASRVALPIGTVGSSLTRLSGDDVSRFMNEMVTESLRYVPGIYVRNNGNVGSTAGITMRGLPIAPVVLIDGVEVNNPGDGNIFNFGNLPIAMIESIEVLRGAQSALYGANALTGVISITTKSGVTVEPAVQSGISYGSRESIQSYVSISQARERVNYFITANFYETSGYSVQNEAWGPEWADDDLFRNSAITGKIGFDLSENAELLFFGNYQTSKSEYDPGTPSEWTVPIADNYLEKEQTILKSQLTLRPIEQLEISASLNYNRVNNYAVDAYGIRDDEGEKLKFELLNNIRLTESYQVVAGFEWEQSADNIGDYEMETLSAFIENIYELVPNLNATFAIRFDDNDTFGDDTTWRTSLSYLIEDLDLRLKGSYGISYDAPEISELFGTWGNPDLTPEDGSSFDVGFEQNLLESRLVWGVSYFSVKMEDYIEYLRSTSAYANVDWESDGFETFIRYEVSDDFQIQFAHTFANATRKRAEDDKIFHSPEHQFSLLLDKGFLNDRVNAALSVQYVGERETWDGATDSFVTVDLAGRFQYNEALEIWLRIDNLLDEEYQEILGYNSPGLGVFGGINYEF